MKLHHRCLIIAAEIPVAIAVLLIMPQITRSAPPATLTTPAPLAQPSPKPSPKPSLKPSPKPPEASAGGTEPFWNLTIDTTGILYSTPDAPKVRFPYVKPVQAEGRPTGATMVYTLRNRTQQGTIVLSRVPSGFCHDGMSDYRYPYIATLTLNNRVFAGCASTPALPRKME